MVERTQEGSANAGVMLSLVVPIFNEDETIDPFLQRAELVLADLGETHEIIFVDDGSRDGSLERLLAHRRRSSAIKIISLSRNFGKDLAMTAGLNYALGGAIVTIDVDLQDPPELIEEFKRIQKDSLCRQICQTNRLRICQHSLSLIANTISLYFSQRLRF